MNENILIGKGEESQVFLLGEYANRHGLVAGATGTGTGKTEFLPEEVETIPADLFIR